jgi:hypothetical protein
VPIAVPGPVPGNDVEFQRRSALPVHPELDRTSFCMWNSPARLVGGGVRRANGFHAFTFTRDTCFFPSAHNTPHAPFSDPLVRGECRPLLRRSSVRKTCFAYCRVGGTHHCRSICVLTRESSCHLALAVISFTFNIRFECLEVTVSSQDFSSPLLLQPLACTCASSGFFFPTTNAPFYFFVYVSVWFN